MMSSIKAIRAGVWVLLLLGFFLLWGELPAEEVVSNQIIVTLAPGQSLGQLLQSIEGVAIDTIGGKNIFLVSYPDSLSLAEALSELNAEPAVDSAQPNNIIEFPEVDQVSQSFPDQSNPAHLEGQSPAGFYDSEHYDLIDADSAHKISTGANVVVAVIDNGIYFDHPLFESAFANLGYDFVDNDTDASEDSGAVYGHGTFVAGIIKRIAPDSKIIPLRAFDEAGYGTCFNVAQAIYRAIQDSADIINMSFSINNNDLVLNNAVQAAHSANIAMTAAPGNAGLEQATYPACYSGVIAVSALNNFDSLADFSNYGNYIDVCAPGVNIYSALAGTYEWGTWSGTSFSAPMAAGICALIKSLNSNLTSDQAEDYLQKTANRNLQWGQIIPRDVEYGYGRLDALGAVAEFNRGDVNFSGYKDIDDIDYLELYLLEYGPEPMPMPKVGDLDCSGTINISDLIILINYLESGGPEPAPCD